MFLLLHLINHPFKFPTEDKPSVSPHSLLVVTIHLNVMIDLSFCQSINHRHEIWQSIVHLRENSLISSHLILLKSHPKVVLICTSKISYCLYVEIKVVGEGCVFGELETVTEFQSDEEAEV